jgi:hypothetical protein
VTDSIFLIYHGVVIKLTPDNDIAVDEVDVGQYADKFGRRMAYYEARYHPNITDSQYTEMIRRVKEIVR